MTFTFIEYVSPAEKTCSSRERTERKWERVKAKTRQSKKKSSIWTHVIWKGKGINETKRSMNLETAGQEGCLSHGLFVLAKVLNRRCPSLSLLKSDVADSSFPIVLISLELCFRV